MQRARRRPGRRPVPARPPGGRRAAAVRRHRAAARRRRRDVRPVHAAFGALARRLGERDVLAAVRQLLHVRALDQRADPDPLRLGRPRPRRRGDDGRRLPRADRRVRRDRHRRLGLADRPRRPPDAARRLLPPARAEPDGDRPGAGGRRRRARRLHGLLRPRLGGHRAADGGAVHPRLRPQRGPLVFGWVFAGHQLGAALAGLGRRRSCATSPGRTARRSSSPASGAWSPRSASRGSARPGAPGPPPSPPCRSPSAARRRLHAPRPPLVPCRAMDDELLNRVTWKIPNALALVGSPCRRRVERDDDELDHAGVDGAGAHRRRRRQQAR